MAVSSMKRDIQTEGDLKFMIKKFKEFTNQKNIDKLGSDTKITLLEDQIGYEIEKNL